MHQHPAHAPLGPKRRTTSGQRSGVTGRTLVVVFRVAGMRSGYILLQPPDDGVSWTP